MPSLSLTLDSDSEHGTPPPAVADLPPDVTAPPSSTAPSPSPTRTTPIDPSSTTVSALSPSSPLPSSLENTESPVEEALRELKDPAPPFWIGDANTILRNCEWAETPAGTPAFLKWRADAPSRPEASNDEVLVGWIGEVSMDPLTLQADGGWNPRNFDEKKAPRHKRAVHLVKPSIGNASYAAAWEAQLKGAKALIDKGSRTRTGAVFARGHSFLDEDMGNFRIRSAMFKEKPTQTENTIDDDEDQTASPFHHCYATWEFSSPAVRAVFDRVVADGHIPQSMEAYDESDNHIHPNDVPKLLPGTIVCVFGTLERTLFIGPKQPGRRAWQFYVNLAKLQILQRPAPKLSASKRKVDRIPTFGAKRRREAL